MAGRRLVKRVYSGATGGTVGYLRMVYAGSQVAFETDSTNTSLSTIYTWGPGVDHLVGVKVGSTAYTVVTDPLGSVRALIRRSDGAWVGRLLYAPYGQVVDSAGPQPALRYRWTGREWDAETGFYFHRTRYYDPGVGRFVQEDRLGYAGGGNLYAYVNGDVLQARDADGLEKEWVDAGGFIPGCVGSSGVMGDGSIVAGGCEGAGGRIAALGAWAASASWLFDLYNVYAAAFLARQAGVAASTQAPFMKASYAGATAIEYRDFTRLVLAVTGLGYGGPVVTLPGDIVVGALAVVKSFAERIGQGRIFVNNGFMADKKDDQGRPALALTPYGGPNGYTVINSDLFFAPSNSYYLQYNGVHEELHYLSPQELYGSPTYHCEIYRATNALTGISRSC